MSDEELSRVVDNSRGIRGIGVGGYNAADVDGDGELTLLNMEQSGTMPFINIDNMTGNMDGKPLNETGGLGIMFHR